MRSDIVHVSSITKLELMKSVCFVLSMLIFLIQAVIFVIAIGEGVDEAYYFLSAPCYLFVMI